MAQLIVYLAAVHAAREKNKTHRTIFGILTDADGYWFACLDDSKNLSISELLVWRDHKDKILVYLDTILRNVIESSSHTTPSRHQNANANAVLHNYSGYLRNSWQFGEEEDDDDDDEDKEGASDDFEEDEPYLVDVMQSSSGLILRSVHR